MASRLDRPRLVPSFTRKQARPSKFGNRNSFASSVKFRQTFDIPAPASLQEFPKIALNNESGTWPFAWPPPAKSYLNGHNFIAIALHKVAHPIATFAITLGAGEIDRSEWYVVAQSVHARH